MTGGSQEGQGEDFFFAKKEAFPLTSNPTPIRLAVCACACAAVLGWALFWAVFHTVPGQDWVVFHTAAALWYAGDLHILFDPQAFTDELNRTHAAWLAHIKLHPFVYPPVTLLMTLAFGWLPYMASLGVFLGVTGALLVAALWPWQAGAADRGWLMVGVFACPATAFTIGSGQLSFLVAACVVGGMFLLERRPFLAGLIFSSLCLKPQFVPLIPVALLAGRHWRAMAGGLTGGLVWVAASLVVIGPGVWVDWVVFAAGRDPRLGRMIDAVRIYDQSVHTCLRMLGLNDGLAGVGQMLALALSAVCVWLVFARRVGARRRLVVLLCAMVLGAPHVGDYDHVLLAIACVLLLIDARSTRGPVWLPAAVWSATFFNPPALIAVLGVPALTWLSASTPFLSAWLLISLVLRHDGAASLGTGYGALHHAVRDQR